MCTDRSTLQKLRDRTRPSGPGRVGGAGLAASPNAIVMAASAREVLRDGRGNIIGALEHQRLAGKVLLRDAHGTILGSYDARSATTSDASGRMVDQSYSCPCCSAVDRSRLLPRRKPDGGGAAAPVEGGAPNGPWPRGCLAAQLHADTRWPADLGRGDPIHPAGLA